MAPYLNRKASVLGFGRSIKDPPSIPSPPVIAITVPPTHSTTIMCKTADGAPSIKVGILGATGTVGQRFITLLANHPLFVIHALGASPRSAGKPYSKAANWKQTTPVPTIVGDMIVHECQPDHFKDCSIVFSGLDADVAGDIGKYPFRISPLRPSGIHLARSHFSSPLGHDRGRL